MIIGKPLTKVFDVLGEILAILTISLIVFLYLNANFKFVTDINTVNMLSTLREYMILGTIIIVGLEFSVKRSFIFFVIFAVIAAAAVVFSFFPESIPSFLN